MYDDTLPSMVFIIETMYDDTLPSMVFIIETDYIVNTANAII